MFDKKNNNLMEKTNSIILLCLGYNYQVMIEVEKFVYNVFNNCLYLKKQLFTFLIKKSTFIKDYFNEFNKTIINIRDIDLRIDDENQIIILICSPPNSYECLWIL